MLCVKAIAIPPLSIDNGIDEKHASYFRRYQGLAGTAQYLPFLCGLFLANLVWGIWDLQSTLVHSSLGFVVSPALILALVWINSGSAYIYVHLYCISLRNLYVRPCHAGHFPGCSRSHCLSF